MNSFHYFSKLYIYKKDNEKTGFFAGFLMCLDLVVTKLHFLSV